MLSCVSKCTKCLHALLFVCSHDCVVFPCLFQVVVDGVPVTAAGFYQSMASPSISNVSPTSAHTTTQSTEVTIVGSNFGPLSSSQDGLPLQVYFTTEFGRTECLDPEVVVEDSVIICRIGSNLGPANATVVYDGVSSAPFAGFTFFDDGGMFSFESPQFFVSERDMFGNVTVIRHNNPRFPSPTNVTIQSFDGSALAGAHFIASNQTMLMDYTQTRVVFQIGITAAAYQPLVHRGGADNDVFVNLRILEVRSLHGEAAVDRGTAILTIRAVCMSVSTVCVAEWDLHQVVYYRTDELP